MQASKAIEAMGVYLEEHWPAIAAGVLKASGVGTVKQLKKMLRAAADDKIKLTEFGFDETNPHAIDWVKQHTADLISGLQQTTRDDIRDLVESAFDGDFDATDLADQIDNLIGDPERADIIARTETMRASNEGQLEAWDQATEAGLLTGQEQIEWITTPDDRLCPICEPLDGETIPMGGEFDVDGDKISAPPAHPRCRCTVGLSS